LGEHGITSGMRLAVVCILAGFLTCLAAQSRPLPPPGPCTHLPANDSSQGNAAGMAPAARAVLPMVPLPRNPDCPVTLRRHFDRYLDSQFSWSALAQPLLTSVPDQAMHTSGYPRGWHGFADRYRGEFLQEATGKLSRHLVLPALFHQDEEYEPLDGRYPVGERLHSVFRHLILTPSADHTREVFNMEAIPAAVLDAYAANRFEPASLRTRSTIIDSIGYSIAWRVSGDALDEFLPEIRRVVRF